MDLPLTDATFCAKATWTKEQKTKMQQTFLTRDYSYKF